ncbi:DUF4166 domain-containing protein [Defluviimonas sp. SAOS-178_SWC]|uniref:DUF4166 domain-containing protein n=1 Tax=Defluviimonas sp. SAOS-178_SWC TaxID=3121287 RepID=UPI003221CB60
MKVVVLGGTGVFGSRLAELLVRDGQDVTIAARDLKRAEALARRLGARAIRVDLGSDLAPLWAEAPDAVVDAAGPFHAYGADPWRLPRACIARGINYLDLADEAEFCAGIATLDGAAKAAGTFALSGVSSVPALSSAAVDALAKGMDRLEEIDTAILPGNRAPRGRSVVGAILARTGTPFRLWQGAAWEERRGWSDPRAYRLGPGLHRRGYLIEVPDTRLFPARFGAHSVSFRAGLELPVMNAGLALLSRLRAATGIAVGPRIVALTRGMALMLWPFGSAQGGMVVRVIGRKDGGLIRAEWRLLAEAGAGPYVPAIAARAILRAASRIPSGAGPALTMLPLAEFEAAMADLSIGFSRDNHPVQPLFPAHLGVAFKELPGAVRRSHDWAGCFRLDGRATVTRGRGLAARLVAAIFRFPPEGADVPVRVTKRAAPDGEIWERDFGGRIFRSYLARRRGAITERFDPFTFVIGLTVRDGALHFPVAGGWLGPLPLPRVLMPVSIATETEDEGGFRFDVELRAPLGLGLIVRYRGRINPRENSSRFGIDDEKLANPADSSRQNP